jgi:hypothetical protein
MHALPAVFLTHGMALKSAAAGNKPDPERFARFPVPLAMKRGFHTPHIPKKEKS